LTLQQFRNATREPKAVATTTTANPRCSIATRTPPHTASAGRRRSYVSHLIEDGVDPLFVQQQVGHSWASTTAIYTTVGADAKNQMLRSALARAFQTDTLGG
jgi:site-specific recombinase XerD